MSGIQIYNGVLISDGVLISPPTISPTTPMILVYKTTTPSEMVKLQLGDSEFGDIAEGTVDWGDGNIDIFSMAGEKTHTYATSGEYTVTVDGTITHFGSRSAATNGDFTNLNLKDIVSFGNVGLVSLENCCYFIGSTLQSVPTSIPSTVTNLKGMFEQWDSEAATIKLDNIQYWDTTNVTDMSSMFYNTLDFNVDIGSWNTGNVTNMNEMFGQNITSYPPNTTFNRNIGSWNTGNVTNMSRMFFGTGDFNQPIGNWNTSNVTNMNEMFAFAFNFNQPIGNWNVSNVTDMGSMFASSIFSSGPTAFSQDISGWNTGNVTDMSSMFSSSLFNSPIFTNTSNVTNMSSMFERASNFNQNIGSWDTSNVTNMYRMFYLAGSFNQDIGNWDTSIVSDMTGMFYAASQFNQDLSDWCVSLIPIQPFEFDDAAISWILPRPVWGTCPP